jgi:hypothetical protein
MIDFPNNPTVGQQFTAAGVTWTWDGTKWTSNGLNTPYLPLSGGTLSGPLTLVSDPTAALQAATKEYVDYIEASYPLGDNRIINGDMRIDQRNNGASGVNVAGGGVYTVDRWQVAGVLASTFNWGRNLNTVPGPANMGFPYCLGCQTTTPRTPAAGDGYYLTQIIEGDVISDFAWGTAQAQPVTFSFWAYSNQTGTFSGALTNGSTRSYPFTFPISAVNTWAKIIVTIPGDTTGTWVLTGNNVGLHVRFDLGSGSNFRGPANAWAAGNLIGATGAVSISTINTAAFLLTGVKLEIGSVATPFNRQSLAKSLADCQRYYQKVGGAIAADLLVQGYGFANVASTLGVNAMRAAPTATIVGSFTTTNVQTVVLYGGLQTLGIVAVAATTGYVSWATNGASTYVTLSAEL